MPDPTPEQPRVVTFDSEEWRTVQGTLGGVQQTVGGVQQALREVLTLQQQMQQQMQQQAQPPPQPQPNGTFDPNAYIGTAGEVINLVAPLIDVRSRQIAAEHIQQHVQPFLNEAAWDRFYRDNPDLSMNRDLVDGIVSRVDSAISQKQLDPSYRWNYIRDAARQRLSQIRGGQPAAPGAPATPTPGMPAGEPQTPSFAPTTTPAPPSPTAPRPEDQPYDPEAATREEYEARKREFSETRSGVAAAS